MDLVERKLTKVGNSVGLTLPIELLKEVGLSLGEHVQVGAEDGKIFLQKKEQVNLPDGVDAAFMDILNDVITEHDRAFKGLVDR